MHCYVKQVIQTLPVNDHRCVFLTNQQANEENNRLSTVVARSTDYPSGKFAPKRKKWYCRCRKSKQTFRSCRSYRKITHPFVNLRPIQLVFSCPFYRSSSLTSRSSTLCTLIFVCEKNTLIKRMVRVLKISWNTIESRSCPCTDHPDNFGSSLVSQFSGSILRQLL